MLERNICTADLEEAVGKDVPEIIEDNPHDPRGPSCLILGWIGEGQPKAIHVLVGYGGDRPEVITAYWPDPSKWAEDFRTRRR